MLLNEKTDSLKRKKTRRKKLIALNTKLEYIDQSIKTEIVVVV